MDRINDAVHKIINISSIESKVIDTPFFQRLRGIKQLSMAYYVYPTSIHNRFDHSIGVMYLADKIFTTIKKKAKKRILKSLSLKYLKNLRMAALLHDLGHFPFSHTLEFSEDDKIPDGLPNYFKKNHEVFSEYIIRNSFIKNILKEDKDYNIDLICGLINGKSTDNFILSNLINWELDADRLDYLLRDSLFTGVSYGVVDYNYLIENFEIYDKGDPHIVINEKAARSIEHILNARYSLYDRVYTHEKIEYYEHILKNLSIFFFDDLIPEYLKNETDFNKILNDKYSIDFLEFNDSYIFNRLYQKYRELRHKTDLSCEFHNVKEDLESLIFRKKNDQIKRYPYLTKQDKYAFSGRINEIEKYIKEIEPKFGSYESEIRLHNPINKFTNFKAITNPEGVEEKQKDTILIIDKTGNLESFYLWDDTYYKKIYKYKNFKTDIYIRNNKVEIFDSFIENCEPKIKELLNFR